VLNDVTLDLAVLGVNAIDARLGASAHHEGEAAVNSLMVARSRRVVIIADASKVGAHAFARICPVDRISALITDSAADPAAVAQLEQAGVSVTLV
jgi:DeoR family transcriptional regulator of aga operon